MAGGIISERWAASNRNGGRDQTGIRSVSVWWQNMREHFVEWHSHLQERVDGYFSQPEPAAHMPGSEPTEPNEMEPQV